MLFRSNRISFKFNGKTYHGFKGDTLASALLANNVHLVGRSFKYHRLRGIMTSGSEEPNAIVQINPGTNRTEPNVRATEVEIYEGSCCACCGSKCALSAISSGTDVGVTPSGNLP